MNKLICLFIRRPVTVIMLLSAVITGAVFSVFTLSVNRLPDISVPVVYVETIYPGMAAEEIRSLVTMPIEDSLSSLRGLERMRSISRDGRSLISLDFIWGTDVMEASVLVREAVDRVYTILPEGSRKPAVTSGREAGEPYAVIAVTSHNGNSHIAHNLAEYEVRARLRRIEGVGSVILAGGAVKEERLSLDMPRLSALGLSPSEITQIIAREITDIPAGNARDGDMEIVVVSSARPSSIESLSKIIFNTGNGTVSLTDAGTLNSVFAKKESIFIYNGKEAVALEIYRRPGSDPIRLSREIRKTIDELNSLFSRDAQIELIFDSAPSLLDGIYSMLFSAFLGSAAVFSVLLLFLRHLKYGILTAFSIPFSIAAGIIMLAITGRSLNSMSLSGLAIGIGLVTDISVIILNLLHRAFGNCALKPAPDEVGNKVFSIAGSSIASTLTTMLVFLPILFLPGILGNLFGDIAFSLTVSAAAGWFYAQFCLPSLFLMFFNSNVKITQNRITGVKRFSLEKIYSNLMLKLFRRPLKVYIIAVLLTITGTGSLILRPVAFINPDEAEEVWVSIISPPGTMLESTITANKDITNLISNLQSVKTIFGRAGAEEEDVIRRADIDYTKEEFIMRCILEKGVKPETALAEINEIMEDTGVLYSIYYPKDRIETLLGLSSQKTYVINGKNRDELSQRLNIIKDYFNNLSLPVNFRPEGKRPELRMYPNNEISAYLSVSASHIAETLYILNEGVTAARLEIEGKPVNVRVTADAGYNTNPADWLENIPVKTGRGNIVYLGSLGRIEQRETESALARLDRSDISYADIQFNSISEINTLLSEFNWVTSANESVLSRYRISILLYIIMVIILLYITMGAQFESFLLPLILMLCIPFSLAGAGPLLLITNSMIDSGAVLGLAALFGLVVNSSIVLFEISSEKIKNGYSPLAAVHKGACERFSAILITAATTIFALIPLLISPLGNSQKSMAAAMLGGLAVSVLLSLFAIPPILIRYFNRQIRDKK